MRRIMVVLTIMLTLVLGVSSDSAVHADGNPYDAQWGGTTYNYVFLSCGAYYDFVQSANSTAPGIHQWYLGWLDDSTNWMLSAAQSKGSTVALLNDTFNNLYNLDGLYDGRTPWDYNSAVASLNYVNNACGAMFPQAGNSADWTQEYNQYGQSAGRQNPCNTLTYSSSNIDPNGVDQWVMRAGVIAGLVPVRVSSGADITITGYSGPGSGVIGNTSWRNDNGWLDHADITIDLNYPYPWIVEQHEIGHALGLGHVAATDEMMHPEGQQITNNVYDAGDIAGLKQHGIYAGSGGC